MSAGSSPDQLTERARVLRVDGTTVWVRCESQAGCARCAAGEGCGAGLFARLLRGRLQELPLRRPAGLELANGDWVLLGLSVSAVQNASLLLYGLPLAGLLAGAVSITSLIPGDLAAFVGAVLGFVAGLGVAHWRGRQLAADTSLEPVLLRRLEPAEPCPVPSQA